MTHNCISMHLSSAWKALLKGAISQLPCEKSHHSFQVWQRHERQRQRVSHSFSEDICLFSLKPSCYKGWQGFLAQWLWWLTQQEHPTRVLDITLLSLLSFSLACFIQTSGALAQAYLQLSTEDECLGVLGDAGLLAWQLDDILYAKFQNLTFA